MLGALTQRRLRDVLLATRRALVARPAAGDGLGTPAIAANPIAKFEEFPVKRDGAELHENLTNEPAKTLADQAILHVRVVHGEREHAPDEFTSARVRAARIDDANLLHRRFERVQKFGGEHRVLRVGTADARVRPKHVRRLSLHVQSAVPVHGVHHRGGDDSETFLLANLHHRRRILK